jgi:hypothetical protein
MRDDVERGDRQFQRRGRASGVGLGVALGIAIGMAVGVATDSLALFLAIGVALGAALGAGWQWSGGDCPEGARRTGARRRTDAGHCHFRLSQFAGRPR